MKGKGKVGPSSPDCPLQFPDLRPVDHTRQCPRYTAVLARTEDDGIGIEEVDTLQTELETLLAAVAKRMRQLQGEINILSNWQEKGKDKKAPPTTPGKGSQSEGKRSKNEEKPNKRMKDSSGKAATSPTVSTTPAKPKGKNMQPVKLQEYEFPESPKPPEPPKLPKSDTPNRIWSLVEPYCAEIANEDLKVLDDLMKSHDDDGEFYKIPALGKHYADKWAQEDLLEEQREGSKISDKRRSASGTGGDMSNLLKRGENSEETSPFGPLTQRLVSALIEENIMSPLEDGSITEADAAEAASISPRSLARQLNIGNTAQLERRIKRELEEQGILEPDDRPEDSPDDEILMELKKKQQELKALSQHNLMTTKRLYKIAKEEIQKQELRTKMAAADAEVLEAYRKIQMIRQKKRSLTKKEKEAALKILKERETLVRQLDAIG